MEKPITLQEFADQHRESIGLIKQVVEVITKNYQWSRHGHCAICDKELTKAEFLSIEPMHFHRTCKEHRQYATCYMIDGIRHDIAGLPPLETAYLQMPE
jgi:hypothetical protein